jgi:hypothetical protein
VDEQDGTFMGTGGYIINIDLSQRLPNWLPMFGQKIKLTYNGISKACDRCFRLHNSELNCAKMSWEQYTVQFKTDNPEINEETFDCNCSLTANQIKSADNNLQDVFEDEKAEGNEPGSHLNSEVKTDNEEQVEEVQGITLNNELSDELILSFLRENEMTESEMEWLKSHGKMSEFEVLKLIGKIMINRANS